ncbi:hypothetical protein GF402_10455 [Candidatus Fermentibacteria bacterium]|nr:hypothetical protein [Candidatus Fermentibacteria bacterium]
MFDHAAVRCFHLKTVLLWALSVTVMASSAVGEPVVQWDYTVGSAYDQSYSSVSCTDDGGVILAGTAGTPDPDVTSALISKIGPQGNLQWSVSTVWGLSTRAEAVRQVHGGYLVCGSAERPEQGLDAFAARLDILGRMEWHSFLGGSLDDEVFDFAMTPEGEYLLTGYTESIGAGGKDIWLVKLDEAGREIWSKTYGAAESEVGYSVTVAPGSGYAVCGSSAGNMLLLRTDTEGSGLWSKLYDNGGSEAGNSVVGCDGGFLMVGSTRRPDEFQMDVFVVKAGADGEEDWRLVKGGGDNDGGRDCVCFPDGRLVVLANTMSYGNGSNDIMLISLSAEGEDLWEWTLGDEYWNSASAIARDGRMSIFIAGKTWSEPEQSFDVWAIRAIPDSAAVEGGVVP